MERELRRDAGGPPTGPPAEVVDVYERGRDSVTISRGSFAGREAELALRPGSETHHFGDIS